MRAWTGKTHILRGWRIVFLRSPCVLSARKTMLQLPGGWGKPVLKVSTKKIAVSAAAMCVGCVRKPTHPHTHTCDTHTHTSMCSFPFPHTCDPASIASIRLVWPFPSACPTAHIERILDVSVTPPTPPAGPLCTGPCIALRTHPYPPCTMWLGRGNLCTLPQSAVRSPLPHPPQSAP